MSSFIQRDTKIIDEGYIFTFGQYKGLSVSDVLHNDSRYILWCHDNIDWFILSDQLYDRLINEAFDDRVSNYISDMYYDVDIY